MKIYAPNAGYSGISASVTFVNGVGETEDENLIAWFESKGYSVGEPAKEKEEAQVKIPNYKGMKKAELEDLLTSLEVEYAADSTNDQKVELLDAYYMNKG
ncbi:hypothetical protein [Acetoanaerobium noterae]|uniref:hypothetical protein n=1 Tax=Acetoanaerobium noterae TaxID=745369 RepID=UPI00333ECD51